MDISLEKAIEFNDWLEEYKWLKIAKCSSGIIGKILKEFWKFGKLEILKKVKKNYTNKSSLTLSSHYTLQANILNSQNLYSLVFTYKTLYKNLKKK